MKKNHTRHNCENKVNLVYILMEGKQHNQKKGTANIVIVFFLGGGGGGGGGWLSDRT